LYNNVHEICESPGDAAGLEAAVPVTAQRTVISDRLEPDAVNDSPVIIPVQKEIPVPAIDPYSLFRALSPEKGFILESMEGMPRRAVRSIIGLEPPLILSFDPDLTCTGDPDLSILFHPAGGGDVLARIRNLLSGFRIGGAPGQDFSGGLVGYCAYDMVTELSGGLVDAGREGGPLARFMLATKGIVYNHVQGTAKIFDLRILPPGAGDEKEYAEAHLRIRQLEERIAEADAPGADVWVTARTPPVTMSGSMSREEYTEAVERAKEHIRAGDIFQVVLSRRIRFPFTGDPLRVYGAIRSINPSPYLYYLNFGDEAIIGSSPEMLVKVEGSLVQTVPIAGTRPRGRNEKEDDRLGREMLADPKERAEHLMLVDLARNDIGRVSAFGSVKVPEFMEIERFSHVQHIVSRVSGVLRNGCDRFDALASCFPAGTVSGAPKIRAMQIISELEAHPRGVYAGAVGYFGFSDTLEFAITIRTLRMTNGMIEYSTGAGIVADSVPEKEFEETEHKAGAMMNAIMRAGGEP
jgi:anthranilate synthase component 1